MTHHLTHDIGWPTLCWCAFLLGLMLPSLVRFVRFEVERQRRFARRARIVDATRSGRLRW